MQIQLIPSLNRTMSTNIGLSTKPNLHNKQLTIMYGQHEICLYRNTYRSVTPHITWRFKNKLKLQQPTNMRSSYPHSKPLWHESLHQIACKRHATIISRHKTLTYTLNHQIDLLTPNQTRSKTLTTMFVISFTQNKTLKVRVSWWTDRPINERTHRIKETLTFIQTRSLSNPQT